MASRKGSAWAGSVPDMPPARCETGGQSLSRFKWKGVKSTRAHKLFHLIGDDRSYFSIWNFGEAWTRPAYKGTGAALAHGTSLMLQFLFRTFCQRNDPASGISKVLCISEVLPFILSFLKAMNTEQLYTITFSIPFFLILLNKLKYFLL